MFVLSRRLVKQDSRDSWSELVLLGRIFPMIPPRTQGFCVLLFFTKLKLHNVSSSVLILVQRITQLGLSGRAIR